MPKEITFYVFLGEKRVPSKIYANSNLCNLTHITQEPSYVYTFFIYTLKEITALVVTDNDVSSSSSSKVADCQARGRLH